MKLGLINSAWAQAGRGTAYGIRETKAIGFDSIDIFADPLDIDAKERRLIRTECEQVELPIISVACVAVGLIDFNPSVRNFHHERCKKYLEFAYELQASNVLLVLGEYIWERQVIPPQDQWRLAVESLKTLGEFGESLGVQIALELEPFRESLLNDVPKMAQFLTDVGHPAVGANIDISHLALAKSQPKELEMLRGRAIHVHISDCDGLVHGDLPPGRGVVEFGPYLEAIRDLQIPGAMSIELEYSPEPDKIHEWVAEAYSATDRLMQAAGLTRG
ncbi:MAG: sugar phosphate isomerase/epimerase family protein [Fimbriiglobus sp.]